MAKLLETDESLDEIERYAVSRGRIGGPTAEQIEVYNAIVDYRELRGLYTFLEVLEIRHENGERLKTMNCAKSLAVFMLQGQITTPTPYSDLFLKI